jgi:hypothetical protein
VTAAIAQYTHELLPDCDREWHGLQLKKCRPRTRGGSSGELVSMFGRDASSPHPRG